MPAVFTREDAASAVAAAVAQRDGIRANLLDLEGSLGKRLLAGARLTGATERRWAAASADLTTLWETFDAYSAVVDRAAGLLGRLRRQGGPELAEISDLLTGTSVKLARTPAPLGRRDLTDSGEQLLTPAAAVRAMTAAFARVSDVVAAAESVWTEVAGRLEHAAAALGSAGQQAHGLADDALAAELAAAQAELARQRDALNSDPLALRSGGRIDTSGVDRLAARATALASNLAELARLRDNARPRIDAVTRAVATAVAAGQDARAARDRAAAKIVATALPRVPEEDMGLTGRLAALDGLLAAGRLTRLAAELDGIEALATAAAQQYRELERQAVALLDRRAELRGLLDAYQAKAARLGAAEDGDLTARYLRARDLLWTAPCDLTAAADAVTGYQQAVLALGERGRRR